MAITPLQPLGRRCATLSHAFTQDDLQRNATGAGRGRDLHDRRAAVSLRGTALTRRVAGPDQACADPN